jgi:hypothetical protein
VNDLDLLRGELQAITVLACVNQVPSVAAMQGQAPISGLNKPILM